jgi:excisionase family DNA binding protein
MGPLWRLLGMREPPLPRISARPTVGRARRLKGPAVPTRPARSHNDAADHLHDVDGAAAYLRCGRRLIYRLVAERKVKFTYAGRSLRFWQSDLDTYLEARAVEPLDFRRLHQ